MHIHNAPAGVSGAIVLPFAIARLDDNGGSGNIPPIQTQFASAAVTLDTIKAIVADPSQFYFNVHTTVSPGGAMRGQLQRAEVYVRMAQMKGDNEVPAIPGQTWAGTGTSITLITRDNTGAINSAYQIFDVKYSGFSDDTVFTAMHIHLGNSAIAGPVTIDSGLKTQVPVPAGGAGTLHYEAEAVLSRAGAIDSLNALVSNVSQVYMNAHTTLKPGGAIRGGLLLTDKTEFQVNLGPDQEVPPITGLTANATGKLSVFTVRNADATVSSGVVIFDANPRFPTGTTFTGMHVHDGNAGATGPVTIDSALASQPILLGDGTGNIYRISNVGSGQTLISLNDLVVNPEKHYWNMHTNSNPGGAVRAQLGTAVTAAPAITGVVNATFDTTQPAVAPGGLFSIVGSNFVKVTSTTDGFNGADLPRALAGVSVTVGGQPARLLYVSPGQINAQSPYEASTVPQQVVVSNANGNSNSAVIATALYAPAIFSTASGPAIFKANGTQVTTANAAAAGDTLYIYATGLGPVTPGLTSGKLTPAAVPYTTAPVTVLFGSSGSSASASVSVAGFGGLYQVTVNVPGGLAAGAVNLQLQMPFAAASPFATNYSNSNVVNLAVK
jgi:uncharacterized protein (TIGR03437 family)